MTQMNLFDSRFVGIGEQSGDLGFPSFRKIADAFDFPYYSISSNDEMAKLQAVLSDNGYLICEVMTTTEQVFEPRSATKKLPDGTLYSPPLEDMYPFLPRDELERNMRD